MSFTTQKLDWIERVIRDNTVPPLARCVATLIGLHYLNRTSGDAWPSHDQLAAALGVSRSTVKRALNGLVDADHLHRDVAHGRGHRNHYRPASETENGSAVTPIGQPAEDIKGFKNEPFIAENGSVLTPLPPENGSSGEPQNPFKKENPFKNKNPLKNISLSANDLSEGRTANGFQAENKPMAENETQAVVVMAETPIPQSSAAPPSPAKKQERRPMSVSIEDYSSFEIWWQKYPKKVAKFDAAKAYGKVLKSGLATTQILLEGATRYAAEKAGSDSQFIKHPTTWLNGGCWMDEPPPSSGLAKKGSVYAGLRSFVEDDGRGK